MIPFYVYLSLLAGFAFFFASYIVFSGAKDSANARIRELNNKLLSLEENQSTGGKREYREIFKQIESLKHKVQSNRLIEWRLSTIAAICASLFISALAWDKMIIPFFKQ